MLVQPTQEHNARGGLPVGRRGGERHGLLSADGLPCIVEPYAELRERVVGKDVIGHRATGCFTDTSDG